MLAHLGVGLAGFAIPDEELLGWFLFFFFL